MNYEKIYNQIIEKSRNESRVKNKNVYYERHHIVPKCLGGTNDKENLVLLTAKEHFICHKLLVEMYPDSQSIKYAFNMMCNRFKEFSASSRYYQKIKQNLKHSSETRKKCSETKKIWWTTKTERSYESMYGKDRANILKRKRSEVIKSMSDESKRKMIESRKNRKYRPMEEKTKQKIREKRKMQDMSYLQGIPRSEETKKKISNSKKGQTPWNFGKSRPKFSDAHKKKISEAIKLRESVKIECPFCNKIGSVTNMRRYHFNNCKHKFSQ